MQGAESEDKFGIDSGDEGEGAAGDAGHDVGDAHGEAAKEDLSEGSRGSGFFHHSAEGFFMSCKSAILFVFVLAKNRVF